MRSSAYQIECAEFRHQALFKVYGKGMERMVKQKKLEDTLSCRFAFMSSTGLMQGEDGETVIEKEGWKTVKSDNKIVMRFFQKLLDHFLNKKSIEFNHGGRDYTVTDVSDINGQSVYLSLGIESVT